jgi:hypothetical protein
MRKLLFLMAIILFFSIVFVSGESCVSDVLINIRSYGSTVEGTNVIFEKSRYQPNGLERFVKEGDTLLIDSVTLNLNASCLQDNFRMREIVLQFMRPSKEYWESTIFIYLQISDPNIETYSIYLNNRNVYVSRSSPYDRYVDSLGNNLSISPLRLDEEGEWKVRIMYEEEQKSEASGFYLVNEGVIIPGAIAVMPRVSVSILETNEKILSENKKSSDWQVGASIVSILLSVISIIAVIIIGRSTIKIMKKTSREQIIFFSENVKNLVKKIDGLNKKTRKR